MPRRPTLKTAVTRRRPSSKIETAHQVPAMHFSSMRRPTPRAAITTTTIHPPSPCPRCTCAIGRIFTFIPITTLCCRSTPPSCAGSRCSARPPAIASPRWTLQHAALVVPFLSARAQQRLAQGFNRALLLTQQAAISRRRKRCSRPAILLTQLLHREQAGLQSFAAYTHSHPPALAMSLEALEDPGGDIEWLADPSRREARGAHDASGAPPRGTRPRTRRECRTASASSGR